MNMYMEKYIKNLRELADYLESRGFTIKEGDIFYGTAPSYISCSEISSFKKNVKAMGAYKKHAGSDLEAEREFGMAKLQVYIPRRKVCERIVTGTRIIPAEAERIVPAKPEQTEDIVKYKCPESFLDIPDDIKKEVAKNGV